MHPTKLEIPGWIRRRPKSATNPPDFDSRIPLYPRGIGSGVPPVSSGFIPDAARLLSSREKKQRVSRLEEFLSVV